MNSDTYTPMVSQETLLEMAQEKVLENADLFSEWFYAETMEPTERRPSSYFASISTRSLVAEVLMKPKASQEQIVAAWQEVRRRYLDDHQDQITREFDRLRAEDE